MTSALRESAQPVTEECTGQRLLAELPAMAITAPPLRLAGDLDEDETEPHICRSID